MYHVNHFDEKNNGKKMDGYADLHLHTTYSDGVFTPEQLLKKVSEVGISAISITDHDSIDGYIQAQKYLDKYNIQIIPGIELSCIENGKEIHLLGYNIDPDNKILKNHLQDFRNGRYKRAEQILQKLKNLQRPVNFSLVLEKAGEAPITRPHIAMAMTELGYTSNLKEAFVLYLGDDKPAYVSKANFSIERGIKLINQSGGLAVLAHPARMIQPDTLYKLIKSGLDGIEIIHPTHDLATQKYYQSIASQYWLLETGGSDFHGNREYDEDNLGKFIVPLSTVESIKIHSVR